MASAVDVTSVVRHTIAVDIDEVIASFVPALCAFHNRVYGTELTAADFFSYTFREVWGVDEDESTARVRAFLDSPEFAELPPIAGARDVLTKHAAAFRFVIVTSRQAHLVAATQHWLQRHYPGVFADALFGNHWGASGVKRSKSDMVRDCGAIALIDDSLAYVKDVATIGCTCILFGVYNWARLTAAEEDALPFNIVRAVSWLHVDAILTRLAAAAAAAHTATSSSAHSGIPLPLGSPTGTHTAERVHAEAGLLPGLMRQQVYRLSDSGTSDADIAAITSRLELQRSVTLETDGTAAAYAAVSSVVAAMTASDDVVALPEPTDAVLPADSAASKRIVLHRTSVFLLARFGYDDSAEGAVSVRAGSHASSP